jgi:hypothetical protein
MPRVIAVPEDGSMAEARGEIIPEGDYFDVLIEKVDEAQTKKTGDDMYVVSLRILDPGPAQNRTLRTWVVLTWPGYNIRQLNGSIGMPTTTDENGGGLYVGDPHEYVGQHTAIKVEHSEYPVGSGEQSASVKRFIVQKGTEAPKPKAASGRTSLPRRGAPAKANLNVVPDDPSADADAPVSVPADVS